MKNCKTLLTLLLALSITTVTYAQKSNVRKAQSSLAKFEEFKNVGTPELGQDELKKAKEAIDKAIEHDKSKDLPETWAFASLIEANSAVYLEQPEAAEKAEEYLVKAKELDTDGKQEEYIDVAEQTLGLFLFNKGASSWEGQNFEEAYNAFDKALSFRPGDTTLTYYAGLAAIQNQNYDAAIDKYTQLVPEKEFSEHRNVVVDLPKLYLSNKDTTNAIKYAGIATKEYPEDNDAAIQHIELNLIVGNEAQVISDIEKQIEQNPDNGNLYYYLGIAYSSADKPEEAINSYKKAVELNPDHIESNTNLAVTIMNAVRTELNDLNSNKEVSNEDYAKQIEDIKGKVKEALPYLQKAADLDANNADALRNLKSYYDFMQDEEKSKEIEEKINSLTN